MPWLETAPMDQRERFIADVRAGLYSMTELCERYGISRKSGYKWLERAAERRTGALADRSRAPHHCPHRIPDAIADSSAPRGAGIRSGAPEVARLAPPTPSSHHRVAGDQHGRRPVRA